MTTQSDVRPLKRVMIKGVDQAWITAERTASQWRDLNFLAAPDFAKAQAEYAAFHSALQSSGAEIILLDSDDHLTLDSLYPRDASLITDKGVILCNMGKPARKDEPAAQKQRFDQLGLPILGQITAPGSLEGGDTAWVDPQTLAVGHGYRTNSEGIRQLRALLDDSIELVTCPLPHYKGPSDVFHLMSIFSPIDEKLAVVYSPLMPVIFREFLLERGYRLIEVPDEEFEMACNVLALSPSNVLAVEGFPITKARMEAEGVTVTTYPGNEISTKGGGGPTCMTRPLERG